MDTEWFGIAPVPTARALSQGLGALVTLVLVPIWGFWLGRELGLRAERAVVRS